ADETGRIGWQLAGRAPVRRKGHGLFPLPGWDPEVGWDAEPVPFEQLPHAADPPRGFVATANARPVPEGEGPYLGSDWVDGYRLGRIVDVLGRRSDWDVAGMQELQRDTLAGPWPEMREVVLGLPAASPDVSAAVELLRGWDGRLSVDSPAALVYELFV